MDRLRADPASILTILSGERHAQALSCPERDLAGLLFAAMIRRFVDPGAGSRRGIRTTFLSKGGPRVQELIALLSGLYPVYEAEPGVISNNLRQRRPSGPFQETQLGDAQLAHVRPSCRGRRRQRAVARATNRRRGRGPVSRSDPPGTLGPHAPRGYIPSVQGVDRAANDLDVLLRHRLLRQPGGFEGFLRVEIRGPDHLATPELHGYPSECRLGEGATLLAASPGGDRWRRLARQGPADFLIALPRSQRKLLPGLSIPSRTPGAPDTQWFPPPS